MWISKNKKAINILVKQRDKIDTKDHDNDDTWVFQTASYIKDFFGEDSPEYEFISQFHFLVTQYIADASDKWKKGRDYKEEKIFKFMNNCIQTIKDKGLAKKPKNTIIGKLSIKDVLLIISALATITATSFKAGIEYHKWSVSMSIDDVTNDQSKKTTSGAHSKNGNK